MCRAVCAIASCAIALVVLPFAVFAQTSDAGDRNVTLLAGNLYRVREGNRYTVFLVTSEGIILGDPLSTPTAMWLRDELNARFPGRPVRFVLLTHHHFDRAEGAAIFQAAERIAHRSFNEELSRARRTLPAFVDAADRDGNGVLDPGELATTPWAALLMSKDRDGDGRVSPDELYRQVQDVRRTYDKKLDISLGHLTVEMIHPGQAHARDMTVLFFPAERIVFAADPPAIDGVPFLFGASSPSELYDWIHAVASVDFDTVLFGDGRMLSRAQLTTLTTYLDALREEVAAGYEEGLTVSELLARRGPSPNPYDSARDDLIDAIYRSLRLRRIFLTGSAAGAYGVRDRAYCASFTTCNTGGAVAGGTTGVAVAFGRVGFAAELQFGSQSWHSRTSPSYDEEFALRETSLAMVARYWKLRRGGSFSIAGGPSFDIGDAKGMYRQKAALAPLGGRHPLTAHSVRVGVTAGVDVTRSVSSRFSIIVPIRITRFFTSDRDVLPGDTTITLGGGLAMRVVRQVH